jgi:hypothetical protein
MSSAPSTYGPWASISAKPGHDGLVGNEDSLRLRDWHEVAMLRLRSEYSS